MVEIIANRYELNDVLGSGGMGNVYRAFDRLTGTTVALKQLVVPADSLTGMPETARQELLLSIATEFRLMASVRHPNIATVYDYGFDTRQHTPFPYMTVELLHEARNIAIAAESSAYRQRVSMLLQLLDALAYLHQRGIVHHDLKPSNILVVTHNEQPLVKVLDFGLSFAFGQHKPWALGALPFTAPELFQTDTTPNIASDLYSVGAIAYRVFTGQSLFGERPSSFDSLIAQIKTSDYDLSPLEDQPMLQQFVATLIELDPASRYENALVAQRALAEATNHLLPSETIQVRESYLQAAHFTGRDAELRMLQTELAEARRGGGRALLIGGESGVGKSRLVDELRIHALVDGFLVLRGQSVAEGGLPYQLWRDALPRLVLTSKLSDFAAGVLKEIIPSIENLIGRSVTKPPEVNTLVAQFRLIDQVIALFQQQSQPILLILEDIHWASESLTVLQALLEIVADLPLFIVATYSTDESHNLPTELSDMPLYELKRLPDEAVGQLAASMLGDTGRDGRMIEFLQRETEGNVFFMVEVVRALAEDAGSLHRINVGELPERVLPGGVQAVVHRRLDRIPGVYQPALRFAALAGRTIDRPVLAQHLDDVEGFIDACAELAVLEVQDGKWRFAHDKMREALTQSLTNEDLRALSKSVAVAVETVYSTDEEHAERAGALLEFWSTANDGSDLVCQKIAHYTYLAGKEALALGNLREALRLAERGLEEDPPAHERMHLLKLAADSYRALSDYPHAAPHYERSLELAREQNDREFEAEILIGLGRTAGNQGVYTAARSYYYAARDIYRELDTPAGIAESLNNLGTVAARQGDMDSAHTYHSECLAIYREIDHQSGIARSLYGLGEVAFSHHDLATALQCFEDSLEIRESIGDRKGAARSLNDLATIYIQNGDYERAKTTLHRSYDMRRVMGDRKGMAANLQNLGWVARLESEFDTAYRQISEALAIQRDIHYLFGQAISLMYLAEVQLLRGQTADVKVLLHDALIKAQQIGARNTILDTLLVAVTYLEQVGERSLAAQISGWLLAQTGEDNNSIHEKLEALLESIKDELTTTGVESALQSGATQTLAGLVDTVLAHLGTGFTHE